jgi:hypothetical protein
MTKRVSLDRLRDISKQRAIRRPLTQPQSTSPQEERGPAPTGVEWPIEG